MILLWVLVSLSNCAGDVGDAIPGFPRIAGVDDCPIIESLGPLPAGGPATRPHGRPEVPRAPRSAVELPQWEIQADPGLESTCSPTAEFASDWHPEHACYSRAVAAPTR